MDYNKKVILILDFDIGDKIYTLLVNKTDKKVITTELERLTNEWQNIDFHIDLDDFVISSLHNTKYNFIVLDNDILYLG